MSRYQLYFFRNYSQISSITSRWIDGLDKIDIGIFKSVDYLDLAGTRCHRNWKRYTKVQVLNCFSLTCAEYLIAENHPPPKGHFELMFKNLNRDIETKISTCLKERTLYVQEWYKQFTRMFEERIVGLDHLQKKAYSRSLLKLHNTLGICCFTVKGYKALILAATHPDLDPVLNVEILNSICKTTWMKIRAFIDLPDDALRPMLSNAKSMGFDFWGLWRGIGSLSAEFNPVVDFLSKGRALLAIILLQHGFPYLSTQQVYDKQCAQLIDGSLRIRCISKYQDFCSLRQKPNRKRMMLILTTFMIFTDFYEKGIRPKSSISFLQILMRSLPDPYVVPSEMLLELKPFLCPMFIKDLEKICQMYQNDNVHGKDYMVYKPRNLQHLCRCAIRRALVKNLKLPEGLNELRLSTPIIQYLSMDS